MEIILPRVTNKADKFNVLPNSTKSAIVRSTTASPIITKGVLSGVKIDGQWDFPLQKASGDAKQVSLGVDPDLVVGRYVNGWFHLVDDQIVEYRDNKYRGFVHNDVNLAELNKRIGFMAAKDSSEIVLRNRTSHFEHKAFSKGGVFDVDIGFRWSAFSPMIESHFEMVRALCSNQMIFGRDTVMSRNIPLINEWEANMSISNDVLKHIFNTTITNRLVEMPLERASLADVELVQTVVSREVGDKQTTPESRLFLTELLSKLSFIDEYPNFDQLSVNEKKRVPVPVTVFDVMNIATEVATHHSVNNTTKLQALATSCIFDKKRQTNLVSGMVFVNNHTFDDADRAFWAETVH